MLLGVSQAGPSQRRGPHCARRAAYVTCLQRRSHLSPVVERPRRPREVGRLARGHTARGREAEFQDRPETWGGRALGCRGSGGQRGVPLNRETEAGHCQEGPGRGGAGAGQGAGKIRGCVGGGRQKERSLGDRSGCHVPDLGGPRVPEEGSWPTGDRLPQLVLEVSVSPSLHQAQRTLLLKRKPACAASLRRNLRGLPCSLPPAWALELCWPCHQGPILPDDGGSSPAGGGSVSLWLASSLSGLGVLAPQPRGGGSQVLGGSVRGRGQVGGVVAWHLEPQGQQGSPILALSFGQNPQTHSLL